MAEGNKDAEKLAGWKRVCVALASTLINLCLGVLYAWSVWKNGLVVPIDKATGKPALCGVVWANSN